MAHSRRLTAATLASVLAGALIAAAWVYATGGPAALRTLASAKPLAIATLVALAGWFVLTRFVRWQFLLRRATAPAPARDSLQIYLASLLGTATPAYVGEAIRCVFLRRRCRVPLRRSLLCLVLERLFDFSVLALLALALVPEWWMRGVLALLLAGAALGLFLVRSIAARVSVPAAALDELFSKRSLASTAALSLVVWTPVALGPWIAAWGLDHALDPLAAIASYSGGTVFGALTLMPAGMGASGSAQIVLLEEHGLAVAAAIATVTLFRGVTTGLCLLTGVVFLVIEGRAQRAVGAEPSREHFDEIASEYGAQFKPHVWELLLARRTARLATALPNPASTRGLDLGCGLGMQARALRSKGWNVVGIEPSLELLRAGVGAQTPTAAASGLALPFADRSVDFVYAIGVLHHMIGDGEQDRACAEIARVLKPGGVLVVQETNTLNPLFRFYMGYVFPILSRIDEGTERWLPPARWKSTPGLELERVEHFTFLPDFIPKALMPPFVALERRLERSALARYSVHYQAVLRKSEATSQAR